MSVNKFMHPRNRYRKHPNFKALAIKYPEFRKYAKQDISGKVSLNFKDLEAVRALTRTLLLEDFSLDVEIPLDRLIPTLPLRLNYLLWIEDLLQSNKITSDVRGIDIGCGASCVYPLLAAKQFGWRMLATEVDMESAFVAGRNVKKNNLLDKIKVCSVKENQMLEGIIEPDVTYDFCICNPPFFSSTDELDPKNVSRSANRPEPRNAHSGTTSELVAQGGETAFVSKIIQDSVKLKSTVRIYSVMLGHKTSTGKVRQLLEEAGLAAASITTSDFCQGHTTRWGVAWTHDPTISFPQLGVIDLLKKKKAAPLSHTFQSDLASTVTRLKSMLEQLQIKFKILKDNKDLCAMEITAMDRTWAGARKKRREEKLKQKMAESCEINAEKEKKANGEIETNSDGGGNSNIKTCQEKNVTGKSEDGGKRKGIETCEDSNQRGEVLEIVTKTTEAEEIEQGKIVRNGGKRVLLEDDKHFGRDLEEGNTSTSGSNPSKKPKLDNDTSRPNTGESSTSEPLLHGSLVAKSDSEGCIVELVWQKGTGGKDSAHQVLQYLKNNYTPH